MKNDYLPVNRNDMGVRGWKQCGFAYMSGDVYMDHPFLGTAIISRLLEARGYKVGIITQPDWKDKRSIEVLGGSRLGFLIPAGNMDSMVNHRSVSGKRRKKDSYTPGGVIGKRPDYAVTVYCNPIWSAYRGVLVTINGVETSLRRLVHYDYQSNKLEHSVLFDSQANPISYGMGKRFIVEIADALDSGLDVEDITFIDGTIYKTKSLESVYDYRMFSDCEELLKDKREYTRSSYAQYSSMDPFSGKRLVEPYGNQPFMVQNPFSKSLRREEMDAVCDLPYMRGYHPSYEESESVPAIREIKFSLINSRGRFSACGFCTLTFRQGRIIQTRSHESLVEEAKLLAEEPDFKDYIHDVGGPTADLCFPVCGRQLTNGMYPGRQYLLPEPCKNLWADHSDYIALLGKLRVLPKVKRVLIRSGIRFDYVLADPGRKFLGKPCEFRVNGRLKVAPEHVADKVLSRMGKLKNSVYHQFMKEYEEMNQRLGKEQYLVSYLMSSHPDSSMKEAAELAEYLRDLEYVPEQVQDFYPTSSTVPICICYTGYDCRTMEQVYVLVSPHEKAMQRALIRYRNPRNYDLVVEALKIAGRTDLIGYGRKCLIRLKDRYRGGRTVPVTGKTRGTGYKTADQGSRDRKPKKAICNIHKRKGTWQI